MESRAFLSRDPVIDIQDLSYSYLTVEGYVRALENVSISIHRGEFVAIIGPVGSGKTTLCRALTGLIPNYYTGYKTGKVTILGKEAGDYAISELASTVGFVFQSTDSQLIRMTVEEEVAFGPENLGLSRAEIEKRVSRCLELVGLKGFERRAPSSLSGGQKQRLAIASILSMDPEILVLDEPTSELDPEGTLDIFTIVSKLNEELGKTVIIVEQKIEPLSELAQRFVLLVNGKILDDSTPKSLFSRKAGELLKLGVRIPEVSQLASIFLDRNNNTGDADFPVTLEEGIDFFSKMLSNKSEEKR